MPSSFIGRSDPGYLLRLERSPANQFVGVDYYDSIIDAHCKQFEGPCRRCTEHISSYVECRRMARAGESLLIRYPRYGATEMRTLAVQGKEATVVQAHQVEMTVAKCGNAARVEALNRTGNLDSRPVLQRYPAPSWPEESCADPACFEYGQATQ
jgi:hypothetical protein